jgi:ABC-type transport system substrate-binding protein
MNAAKWFLLVLVAGLLIYTALDRRHEQEQLIAIHQSLTTLDQKIGNLRSSPPVSTTTAPTATTPADPKRTGNPALGVNFLLPYDRSTFHPEWRHGTLKEFAEGPRRLNPIIDNSSNSAAIAELVNDSLCSRSATHPEQWSEALATSVLINDDWKSYTFTLRHGVFWQKPLITNEPGLAWLDREVELTAEDFVFAIDIIMNPTVECPSLRNYFEDLEKWEALDRYTLKLTWKKKLYTSLTTSCGLSPIPRHIYGYNRDGSAIDRDKWGIAFNQHWFDDLKTTIGVGPYQLAEFKPDQYMKFTVNPHYWGCTYHFDTLEWNLAVKRPDPQLVAFANGQVHDHVLTPLQYKSEILDRHDPRFAAADPANPKAGRTGEFGWERVKIQAFSYFGWNMRRPPFDDKRVRQAMSYAFPKERVLREIYFGLCEGVNSDVNPDSQYYNKELNPYSFDLAHAAALLDEAGWRDTDGDGIRDRVIDGKKQALHVTIKYIANRPDWDNTLQIYRQALRQIGVELDPQPYEWKELIRVFEDKDFEAVVSGWHTGLNIDFYQLWHSSQADAQGGSNFCGFKNARVDELAIKLRETFDTGERIRIAKEIQSIINEEQPYTFFRTGGSQSVDSIFIWQNKGSADQKDRWLDGVIEGLDTLHPLFNRTPIFWRLPQ